MSERPAFEIIASRPREPDTVLKYINRVVDQRIEQDPQSRLSFWVREVAQIRKDGLPRDEIDRILNLRMLDINPRGYIPLFKMDVSKAYYRLKHAADVREMLNQRERVPIPRRFLIPSVTNRMSFFRFINAGLVLLEQRSEDFDECEFGGEKIQSLRPLENVVPINLEGYTEAVNEASLELFQKNPPYKDLLSNLMTRFYEEVLPQLRLKLRRYDR